MDLAQEFCALFKGSDLAHSTFDPAPAGAGKRGGSIAVLREPASVEHWRRHLGDTKGLGVIPIDSNDQCHWGALDVDDYNVDHKALVHRARKQNIPVVVGRSKSGGAHVWLFFSSPVEAYRVRELLKEISAKLGISKAEIFPKQDKILTERGDVGNPLNMPYHGDTKHMRYAYNDAGEALTAAEFIPYAKSFVLNPVEPLPWAASAGTADEPVPDGPPCLQLLCAQGFGPGVRANALFNMGVYARKRWEEGWEDKIWEYNDKYLDPPLEREEVENTIKSLLRKDYFYKCNDAPICDHCDKDACKLRKYGVASNVPTFEMDSLTKLEGDPPIWLMNVEGQRVELPTEGLVSQAAFTKACVMQINKHPKTISSIAWQMKIQTLLDNVTVVEASKDATNIAEFQDLLVQFCTERAKGDSLADIVQGISVWEDDKVAFHIRDFIKHLHLNDFKVYNNNKITTTLKELGGEQVLRTIRNKPVLLWVFPQSFFQGEDEEIPLPPLAAENDVL